jgi:TetR/AcrR family transcriptional regulator
MTTASSTEQKILLAAKDVFIKQGLYGARMQDIADAAGINKALLHYYFRSKDLLFNKVFEEAFLNYIATMDIWTDESLSFIQKLQKYVDVYIDFLTEYPLVPLFLMKEISTNPEILREKIQAKKRSRNCPTLIEFLRKELPQHSQLIKPEMLMMNIQSLCTYPFLGEALYKSVFKLPLKDWDDFKTIQLKRTVKKFIEDQLS